MKRQFFRPPAAPLIVFLAATLAALFGATSPEIDDRPAQMEKKAVVAAEQDVVRLNPAAPLPANAAAIAEHPLLAQGRIPTTLESTAESEPVAEPIVEVEPESLEPPAEMVSEAPPDVRLMGIISTSSSAKALLRDQYDESEQWLAVGDTIQGWALVEITQSKVVLRAGGDEITIQMFE
jgi:hypothetical protein